MTSRRATLYGRVAATVGVVVFGALALASGFDRLSAKAPALARYIPSFMQAEAARSEARLAVVKQEPDVALAHASRAVAVDPLHPSSTALLGTAYLLNGDAPNAESAFRVAARFGWRDAATQLYWYEAALQANDLPRAVDRADALLRSRPGYGGLEMILVPLESSAEGRAALISRMSGRPDWLRYYLQPDVSMGDDALARKMTVLAELGSAGTKLGCDTVRNFVTFALQRGSRNQAAAVWSGHCPGATIESGLADGDFEQFGSATSSPFGWTEQLSGDVTVQSVEAGAGNKAVEARNQSSVSRLVLLQTLSLPAGEYRLSGSVPSDRLAASVACGQPPAIPSGTVGDIGSGGQRLSIPTCERLQLGLWLRSGGEATRIDDLKLEKVG